MGKARSPNYPAISLPEAVSKVRQLYNAEHRNRLSREAIAGVLGYGGLTGSSQPIISALNKYGLIEGRGDSIRVSDDAIAILVDRKGSPERVAAVKRCASSPKIFADLEKQYEQTPSEDTARIYLEKRGFTPDAAQRAAVNYRDTQEFVTAEAGDFSDAASDGSRTPVAQVGDFVQWESQGVLQFREPRRVVGFSEDGEWVFVEGSQTGVPRTEIAVEPSGKELEGKKDPSVSPPSNPFFEQPRDEEKPFHEIQRAVLPLDEGDAVLEWPTTMSPESAQDLEAWLHLLVGKVKRSAGILGH